MSASDILVPIELDGKSRRCFAYTDNNSAYMMFSTSQTEQSDGIVLGDKTLIYDFGIQVNEEFLPRTECENTRLELGGFSCIYGKQNAGIRISVRLLDGVLHIAVSNADAKSKGGKLALVLVCPEETTGFLCNEKAIASNLKFSVETLPLHTSRKAGKLYKKVDVNARLVAIHFNYTELDSEFYVSLPKGKAAAMARQDLDDMQKSGYAQLTYARLQDKMGRSGLDSGNNLLDKAFGWAKYSGYQFLTKRPSYGIWAGLPWFRDNWGRDTFIALPGILLTAGLFQEARDVIKGFSLHQDVDTSSVTYGRIPNRYDSEGDIIYNNADGTLWFIREVVEYGMYTGDMAFLEEMWSVVRTALNADLERRTDDEGFLVHGDADTWMDARLLGENAWSPRGNRANDVQALWYVALGCGAYIGDRLGHKDDVAIWRSHQNKLRGNFLDRFWNGTEMADCILADGTPDFRCRPNQMFVATTQMPFLEPLLPPEMEGMMAKTLISKLLFPYGICSLEQNDPYFHPYHIGCKKYQKDAAYHNGTIWLFNSALAITFLCHNGYRDNACELLQNIAGQFFDIGCSGTLSENLNAFTDKHGNVVPTGTWSQAWSVSEFNRAIFQDIIGIRPNLLEDKLHFAPELPQSFPAGSAMVPLSTNTLELRWDDGCVCGETYKRNFTLALASPFERPLAVVCGGNTTQVLELYDKEIVVQIEFKPGRHTEFAVPGNRQAQYKMPKSVRTKNYLEKIVAKERYNGNHMPTHTSVR